MNLPIEGEAVTGVDLNYSLTLHFGKRRIRIENEFDLLADNGTHVTRIAAGDDEVTDVDPARFRGAVVLSARYDADGSLFLSFDSGDRIVVYRDQEYESWEFSGNAGEGVVVSPDILSEN